MISSGMGKCGRGSGEGWAYEYEKRVHVKKMIAALLTVTVTALLAGFCFLIRGGSEPLSQGWEERVVEGRGGYKIAQIFIEGEITSAKGSNDTVQQLKLAMNDPQVKGVVVHVNSPGGDVVASDLIYRRMIQLQESGRLVYASMGAVATSGGYYISAPADKIYANPSTITGSIGVVMALTNYKELADRIGYEQIIIASGKNKAMGNPLREVTDDTREIYQSVVEESFQRFARIVAEGRGLNDTQVTEVADGRILSGEQAQKYGLVDKLGDLEEATQDLKEALELAEATIVTYERSNPLWSSFSLAGPLNLKGEIEGLKEALLGSTTELKYIYQ